MIPKSNNSKKENNNDLSNISDNNDSDNASDFGDNIAKPKKKLKSCKNTSKKGTNFSSGLDTITEAFLKGIDLEAKTNLP